MAMRYRHLAASAKEIVGVYRSDIHGRGLFCKKMIEAGEMIMEYAGVKIRSVLTDKQESYYESKVCIEINKLVVVRLILIYIPFQSK